MRKVQTTLTRIFIVLESESHDLSENCDGISRKPRKYIRYFSPKTGGLQNKKKKRSSSKLSHILRPNTEILTFFLPKIRWSPKKKKKRSSSILILIFRSLFYAETILRFLQGTKNNFAGYDKLLGGMIAFPSPLKNYWGGCIPPIPPGIYAPDTNESIIFSISV